MMRKEFHRAGGLTSQQHLSSKKESTFDRSDAASLLLPTSFKVSYLGSKTERAFCPGVFQSKEERRLRTGYVLEELQNKRVDDLKLMHPM